MRVAYVIAQIGEDRCHALGAMYAPRHHDAPDGHLGVQKPAPVSLEVLGQVGLTGDLDQGGGTYRSAL